MKIDSVTPLKNEDYFIILQDLLSKAKKRVWVNMFLTKINYYEDESMRIRFLIDQIVELNTLNLDIKFLIGEYEDIDNTTIRIANETSAQYLLKYDVNVKFFNHSYKTSSHAKYFIIDDDEIVLGSHNLSSRSVTDGLDDSVYLKSIEMAKALSKDFLFSWNSSKEFQTV